MAAWGIDRPLAPIAIGESTIGVLSLSTVMEIGGHAAGLETRLTAAGGGARISGSDFMW